MPPLQENFRDGRSAVQARTLQDEFAAPRFFADTRLSSMKSVAIRIPASTSNLGPGYDCLGVALALHNQVTVSIADGHYPSTGEHNEEDQPHPMVQEVARRFFTEAGRKPFLYQWRIDGNVPMSRGLGSSVTLRLGLLHALNMLAGRPSNGQRLFELCAGLEGHPDNAAPAQFGGFTVAISGERDSGAAALRFPVSADLRFVLLIPNFEVRTDDARKLLPAEVSRLAAVASCGRACRITAAFASRRYERLRDAFEDSAFHQPHRLPLVPFLPDVLAAGRAAGALGGFLSGSGSTVACLTLQDPERVGAAMKEASGQDEARVVITTADNRGACRVKN